MRAEDLEALAEKYVTAGGNNHFQPMPFKYHPWLDSEEAGKMWCEEIKGLDHHALTCFYTYLPKMNVEKREALQAEREVLIASMEPVTSKPFKSQGEAFGEIDHRNIAAIDRVSLIDALLDAYG